MRIHVLSNLHLEITPLRKNMDFSSVDADITVLAGDKGIGLQGRVVSKPRGYGGIAEVEGFDPYLVVEA